MHGPVLARNPLLADHLLQGVTGGPLPALELPDQEAVRQLHVALSAAHPLDGQPRRRLGVRAVLERRSSRHPGPRDAAHPGTAHPDG
jgi:hypothetical protein